MKFDCIICGLFQKLTQRFMKTYTKLLPGALALMLVLTVLVSFNFGGSKQLLGNIRDRKVQVVRALPPCYDTDVPASSYFSPIPTTPQASVPGKTSGDYGTMGVTLNKDRCAGNTLREYYCDTARHQERADIECDESGLSCLEDTNGLGYCG